MKVTIISFSSSLLWVSAVQASECSKTEIQAYIKHLREAPGGLVDFSCGIEAVPALTQVLNIEDAKVRIRIARALGSVGSGDLAVSSMLEILQDQTQILENRTSAIRFFSEETVRDTQVFTVLLEVLNDTTKDTILRYEAARSLGNMSDEGSEFTTAISTLINVVANDERASMRTVAITSLGNIGSAAETAVPTLIQALGDEGVVVRQAATIALGKIGAHSQITVPALITALEDDIVHVRSGAANSLRSFSAEAPKVVPSLIEALDDEYIVRGNATWALGEISRDLEERSDTFQEIQDTKVLLLQVQKALDQDESDDVFEDARLRVNYSLGNLENKQKILLFQAVNEWTATSKNIWLVHAFFWFTLIFLYPQSSQIQAIFFWNPWMRKIMGLGYVGILLTWVPLLRQRLFLPFKHSLLADANLENFDPETYFKHSKIQKQGTGSTVSQQDFIKTRGQKVLVGNSGLGKSMLLRYLCQQSQRIMVYLPATKCIDGVIQAIQRKLHGEEIKDPAFLQNLIYSGAIDICIDGLNEVSAETRAKIVEFTENYFKGNIILATQPMEWMPPTTATLYELQPLEPVQIQAFLLSRKSLIPDYAPVRGDAYEQACSSYLEQVFREGRSPEETEMIQRILSNSMDLTVVASMLAAGQQPNIARLQEQQYAVMAADYDERHIEGKFPLDLFSEAVYQMRLQDQSAIPADFLEELHCLERHKMAVSRQSQDAEGKSIKEWYFRHDKIMEFFILKAFLLSPERQEQHLGDPRFRGVYFLLANFLELKDAITLREMLIQYAADTKDHTVSDTFVQLLRSRKTFSGKFAQDAIANVQEQGDRSKLFTQNR